MKPCRPCMEVGEPPGAVGPGEVMVKGMMVEDMVVMQDMMILVQAVQTQVDMMDKVTLQGSPTAQSHLHHLQDLHLSSGGSESLELFASRHHHLLLLLLLKMALQWWQSLNTT